MDRPFAFAAAATRLKRKRLTLFHHGPVEARDLSRLARSFGAFVPPPTVAPQYYENGGGAGGSVLTESSPGGFRVLVVEDDADQREALCEGLENAGFKPTAAEHGIKALELLRLGLHPDIIVLDLVMPEMDGWTFRLEQRKHATWSKIPVIALSSEQRAQAEAIDAAAFLQKPVHFAQLVEVARGLIAAAGREQMEQMEKMASLGLLAAGVAHEINNPLSYALSNLRFSFGELQGWAKAGGTTVSVARDRLEDVLSAISEAIHGADRVAGIVSDLRTFARADGPCRTTVDLGQVVASAIKLAMPQARHRASVVTELGEMPPVEADEAKLVQLLLNLIVNAAQAMPSKGPAGTIVVRSGRAPSGMAFIEVEDTGEGIPLALRERIFEPFFTTKPPGIGTGLGLAICRRIAQEHGGGLTVESRLGQGSRFRLELPGT